MTDPRYPIGKFAPPATFTTAQRAESIEQIAQAPAQLRAAVQGLTHAELLTPYRDGGWTVAQVVHHLADSHANAYVRFRLAATEDNPTVKPYDEGRWAALADASTPDIESSLAMLESMHTRMTSFLRALTPDQFDRRFTHPERGPMTIDRNVALYAWHGRHHVAHVTSLRERMGW